MYCKYPTMVIDNKKNKPVEVVYYYKNVIDHSNADIMNIKIDLNALNIEIFVIDNGVGIFNKIQKAH